MTAEALRRIEKGLRGLTPVALTLALMLMVALPLPLPGFAQVTPAITLIAVYHWSIYRPDLLPLGATFALGLIQDVLTGAPLGLTSLVLLLLRTIVVSQRRFFHGKTFMVEWWGFMLVAPGATVASWMLVSLYFGTVVNPRSSGVQLVLTVALYPVLTWLFGRAQHSLLKRV